MVARNVDDAFEFTAHNIAWTMEPTPNPTHRVPSWTIYGLNRHAGSLKLFFPRDKRKVRLADVGCLEGGYAVEFAQMGFQVVGIEVRESNIAACNHVKSKTDLPRLEFVQEDALNIAEYGESDAVFCSGLLYHLDRLREFLEKLSAVTNKLLILQTHFSPILCHGEILGLSTARGSFRDKLLRKRSPQKFKLSAPSGNEGLAGRWFTEFGSDGHFSSVKPVNGHAGTIVGPFGFNLSTCSKSCEMLDSISLWGSMTTWAQTWRVPS